MRNDREENINTDLVGRAHTKEAGFSKVLLWVVGGAAIALIVKKLVKLLLPHNPPIIIKSGSFVIAVKKVPGFIGGIENDNDTFDEDADIVPAGMDRRYKHERRSVNYVTHIQGDSRTVYEFVGKQRCVIKFFFGGCPSDDSDPDVLINSPGRIKRR